MQQIETPLQAAKNCNGATKASACWFDTRRGAFLAILLYWAVTYLPILGLREFEVMEPIRVMATDSILRSGNWVVPQVLGEDYYNKPPGQNWLIAASFAISGSHSELAARLPSAVFILAFVALLIWMPSPWLSVRGRLLGAIVFLSMIGIADAGRRAEIEPVYISLTGMAVLWWLNTWAAGKSQWAVWLVPAILLAYGALVKGPLLGVIFYLTIVTVLLYHRRLGDLFCWAHLVAILLIIAISLGWVYLAYRQGNQQQMLGTWAKQWLMRIKPSDDVAESWNKCRLQTLAKLLPWLVFIPLLWIRSFTAAIPEKWRSLFRACRLSAVICYVLLNLAPGSMPRYALPSFPLFAVAMGWLLAEQAPPVRGEKAWKWVLALASIGVCVGLVAGWKLCPNAAGLAIPAAFTILVAVGILWRIRTLSGLIPLMLASALLVSTGVLQHESMAYQDRYRSVASAVNASMPKGEQLYFCPQRNSILMCVYLRHPVRCLNTAEPIGPNVRYVFACEKNLDSPMFRTRLAGKQPGILNKITFDKFGQWVVADLDAPSEPTTAPVQTSTTPSR